MPLQHPGRLPGQKKIPLLLKIVYTLFCGVLVPFYWLNYGPQNFLWFCDVALLMALPALWLESRLLASVPAVGILLLQLIWIADFLVRLVSGGKSLGFAEYMFDPQIPLFVRGLSSFHGWLPLLLFWVVWRLGYDRRALLIQTCIVWLILVMSFFLTERPRPSLPLAGATTVGLLGWAPGANSNAGIAVLIATAGYFDKPNWATNVNWVFGLGKEQTWMSPGLYLLVQMAFYPLCIYVPTHLLLRWQVPRPPVMSPE